MAEECNDRCLSQTFPSIQYIPELMTPKDAAYKRAHRVLKIGIVSNLVASPSEQTPHKVRKG